MEEYVVDGETFESVKSQLLHVQEEIKSALTKLRAPSCSNDRLVVEARPTQRGAGMVSFINNGKTTTMLPSIIEMEEEETKRRREEFGGFALIINGHSLVRNIALFLLV